MSALPVCASEIVLLLGRVHVGAEDPFLLRVDLLNRPKHDLVGFHFETWSQLLCLNLVELGLAVQMMSE